MAGQWRSKRQICDIAICLLRAQWLRRYIPKPGIYQSTSPYQLSMMEFFCENSSQFLIANCFGKNLNDIYLIWFYIHIYFYNCIKTKETHI